MVAIDSAIRKTYVDFGEVMKIPLTADDILCDPHLEDQFWNYFDRLNPSFQNWIRPEKNRVLLRLRKRGQSNGGLPRKSR